MTSAFGPLYHGAREDRGLDPVGGHVGAVRTSPI